MLILQIYIKSKEIVCPICNESASISMNNYKISISGCKNGHRTENIPLNEFEEKQKINISKIICDQCKAMNMGNVTDHLFFRCLKCNKNLCLMCKTNHESTHNIINYEDKYYFCDKHGKEFIIYCSFCSKNLCFKCQEEHENHNPEYYKNSKSESDENLKIGLKAFKEKIDSMNSKINNITTIFNTAKNNFELLYNIKKNMYDNMNKNYRNFQQIKNKKFINDYNEDIDLIINEIQNFSLKITELMNNLDKKNLNFANFKQLEINKKVRIDQNGNILNSNFSSIQNQNININNNNNINNNSINDNNIINNEQCFNNNIIKNEKIQTQNILNKNLIKLPPNDDYSNSEHYLKYIKNVLFFRFLNLYNFYKISYNSSGKFFLIRGKYISKIRRICNYDNLTKIFECYNIKIDSLFCEDKNSMINIINKIPVEILEKHFLTNCEAKHKYCYDIEPDIITINNNEHLCIYNNYGIIDQKVANLFFEGFNNIFNIKFNNYIDCTLNNGKIIINYENILGNKKYVSIIGSVDPSDYFISNEYALIYERYEDYRNHNKKIKNSLNNYIKGFQLYNGEQPIINNYFKEIGKIIQIQKENPNP